MNLQVTIHPTASQTKILGTDHGNDFFKAVLPPFPEQRRALPTLLEGLAMWYGRSIDAVVVVDDSLGFGRVEDLWDGGLWPTNLSNVRFEIAEPSRQTRLWESPEFDEIHAMHGVTR